MKKFAIAAMVAVALAGSAQAAQQPQDPIKQECHKQNPKDHKAYLKCVQEHSKQASGQSASAQPAAAPAPTTTK